jgi:hypothetical protein
MSRKEMRLRRQARRRAALRWGALAAGTVTVLFQARLLWRQAFRNSPEFAVGRFEYRSNGGIPARQAASVAGLRSDMNLMEVDLGEIRSRLLALPRVKSVKVERRLPDRLAIEIEERLPVAWVTSVERGRANNIDQRSRLFVDREGVVFKCEELLREYMALPVINAVDQPVITLGREINTVTMTAALALLEEIRSREWSVPCSVNRIDITNPWTLAAEMESGAVFTFRPEGLRRQLERLEFILAKSRAHPRQPGVASVNLQMQRNVPVTFYEIAAEADAMVRRPGTVVPLVEAENVFYPWREKAANKAPAAAQAATGKEKQAQRGPSASRTRRSRQAEDISTILKSN